MLKIQRAVLLIVGVLLMVFKVDAAITLNGKWSEIGRPGSGRYQFSIAPVGKVDPIFDPSFQLKCYSDTCKFVWWFYIQGDGVHDIITTCTDAEVGRGASWETALSLVNQRMIAPCTFKSYLTFKGDEKICLRLRNFGDWIGSSVAAGSPNLYRAGNGCDTTGGENGGTINPPVEPASCQIAPYYINLRHPLLNANELAGNKKSENINVSCNRASQINVKMTGLDSASRLALDRNGMLYSKLTLDNVPAQQGVGFGNVGPDGVNINLTSTLIANGDVNAGSYSSSAVLIVSIL